MDQALKSIRLLSPNVFVFDVNLPDLTGLPSGADIALAAGNVRLVLYTELPSADLLRWAAQEFVDLVVPKSLEVPVFVDLLADPSASTPKGEFDVDFKLTPDELRVLAWLASDQSADRIARNLGVGKEAAATLISETIEKMGADDREQAIRRFSSVLAPSWGSGQQSRQRRQSPDGA
jgi:DNA-binding NarL/FixJ family response regulator